MKIEWARYIDDSVMEEVYYQQLDDTLYSSQYNNKLFCITENCEAEIKFTERKDGVKFFSTMNGQGTKHLLNCPFYLNYEGEVPRKKLIGIPVDAAMSDDWILNTLLNKSRDMKNKDKPRPKIKNKPGTTLEVINSGEELIGVPKDTSNKVNEDVKISNIRYGSINSKFVTREFLGERKRVFGTVTQSEFVDGDEAYGYIRLQNDEIQIDAYFPQAFYADSRITTKSTLKAFLKAINDALSKKEKITIICLGLLEENKNTSGMNINITNYQHILVNEDKYYKVATTGNISSNPYPE